MIKLKSRDFPTPVQAAHYEIHGSPWIRWVRANSWLGALIATCIARKVNRRFKRIAESMEFERKSRITNPEMWEDE